MINKSSGEMETALAAADPRSGSSLVPMLAGGLILIVIGMIAALAFS